MSVASFFPTRLRVLILAPFVTMLPAAAQLAPSSPDAPLPRAAPAVEKARAAHDVSYTASRLARQGIDEVGRPPAERPAERALPATLLGADPVVNLDSGLGYSSLQAAINAATAGDTLQVEQDLDEGPVTVDRDLFIQGATGAESVRPTENTGTSGDARGWFLVNADVALVVRDLIFDGNGFSIYQAFRHRGFGLFERVTFRDIQFEPSGPLYQGTAIVAFGDRVDVESSAFEQIGRVGVLFFGSEVISALYRGNRYVGKGDGDFLDYAVELNGGATAWIVENSIRDNRGVASSDGSTSAGILATTFSGGGTALSALANDLVQNGTGLAIGFAGAGDTTAAMAAFNRIFDNGTGMSAASSQSVDAENNWWGCNEGPDTLDCDTTAVSGGTIDADPWLVLESAPFRWVKTLGTIFLEGEMTSNSDGMDLSSLGHVPDGIPGTFSAGGGEIGSVVPAQVFSSLGVWRTVFVAGSEEGETTATLTVDNETVETTVQAATGLFCDGFESGDTSEWSATVN